jgi:uncharacterized protein (TIGR02391 family)
MTQSRGRPPTNPHPANLSPVQIRNAIPLLESRIKELEDFRVAGVSGVGAPKLVELMHAINSTVGRVFGTDSLEYGRLKDPFAPPGRTHGLPSNDEIQRRVERQQSLTLLRKQIALMKEQLGEDADSGADRAIRAYRNLDLHPEIARAASGLYRDVHYADAIEDAVKALNARVRLRSGVELDGVALMQKVFSPNSPVLRFNDLADQSERDEQQGFMMMFSGAVASLRNPRAHKLIKDDPERALEFIAFVSLLAKLLDGAKKAPSPASSTGQPVAAADDQP